jgi:hypothetical protein
MLLLPMVRRDDRRLSAKPGEERRLIAGARYALCSTKMRNALR